jgi:DHA2 family multidrug resistance protein
VAAAVMIPTAGWFASRFGRPRVFVVAVAGFTVASVLCGLSQSISQIVLARLLQGMFGAALVPLAQAVMIDAFPLEQRGQAMAMFGVGVMVGPILGPTLGGWLTEHYSWRWVFYVNVPIGIVCTFGLATFLPETKRVLSRFDWTGFLMLGLGVGAMQAMLDRGQELDWFSSKEIIWEACASVVGIYCFMVHFFLAPRPFISPALLKDRNFLVGISCMFLTGMVMYATLALLSPYLQTLMGYPVMTAGLAMAPSGMGTMLAMFVCGRLLGRIAARWLVMSGFGALAFALYLMTGFTPDVAEWQVVGASFLQGASIGFVFVALSTVTFATLAPELRTQGTSLYSLLRNLGSSIGISVTGALLQRNMQVNHASIAAGVTPFNRLLQTGMVGRFWNPMRATGAAALNSVIDQQSATIAYIDDFKLMMIVALIAAPVALLIRPQAHSKPDPAHAVME